MRNATLIYLNLTKQGKQTSKLRCKHTARWGCLQGNVYIDFPEPTPYHLHIYRTRAIIGRSRFEAALVYKPRILGLKNEEFPSFST